MQFKGTPRFPGGQADKDISRAGGYWNAMTYIDWTTYFATMPAGEIDLILQLEADRMHNSLFDPGEVDSERSVIISERQGNENNPGFLLDEQDGYEDQYCCQGGGEHGRPDPLHTDNRRAQAVETLAALEVAAGRERGQGDGPDGAPAVGGRHVQELDRLPHLVLRRAESGGNDRVDGLVAKIRVPEFGLGMHRDFGAGQHGQYGVAGNGTGQVGDGSDMAEPI